MTEMTTTNSAALSAPHQAPAAVVQISDWAAELDAAHKLGTALSTSGMIPDALKKEGNSYKVPERLAADAAVVILAGKSVGLDPLTAVQNIFPVYGRPSMYSRTMVGLALAQGHELERTEATASSVTVRARRKGKAEWHSFTWDMDRAKSAGYTSNKLYQRDPIAMLTAKAQAEACRNLFADVLLGMPYSVEESQLEDLGEVEQEAPKSTVKRKTTTKRKSTPKAEEKPQETEEEPEPEAPAAVTGEGYISEKTWAEIDELAKEGGVTDTPHWVASFLGRKLQGWSEITEAEGDQLLATLTTGETS